MLSASGVSVTFGDQSILADVSLTLDRKSRSGLVGANGSGKTTLMRILAGIARPDSGTITQSRAMTVSYLPQQSDLPPESSVYQAAEDGFRRERVMEEHRHSLATRLESDPHTRSLVEEIAALDHDLEEAGYHTRHVTVQRVLNGLGFGPEDMEKPIRELSGGWAMRVVLARTLLERPDLLLLDEPTNYLDTESRLWLARFLQSFEGGVLLVSHDRAFLDETTDEILELFLAGIKRYRGPYSAYEARRREELELLSRQWEEQQREIARQEVFIRRFRAQANKARQVQSRIRMLEKTERISLPEHLRPVTISLPAAPRSARHVIEIEGLSKQYGPRDVLRNVSLTVPRGSRLAVVGRNGAGKSTLLRILAGVDEEYVGTVNTGTGVLRGYFAQDSPEQLPADDTVLAYLERHASPESRPKIRDILGAFLFSGDTVDKKLRVLSGGERTRLAMAAMLVRPINLLVLDEPTNHLDMTSQAVLARALEDYEGTVVFVSHDRHFLRSVATSVLALWRDTTIVADGWRIYPGSYRDFEESALGAVFAEPDEPASSRDEQRDDRGARRYEDHKARKSEIRRLGLLESQQVEQIALLEREHQEIQTDMARPEIYSDADAIRNLQARLSSIEEEIETLHARWEETTQRLESLSI
jgi:ATP-binding cassette, subfamily F, member 3